MTREKPSHKALNSVVRSLERSFTSLMNYYGDDYVMGHVASAAWSSGSSFFHVDLLSGATDSSPLLVPQVRTSVTRYVEWFPDMVRRSNSSMEFVMEAALVVTVDPTQRRPWPRRIPRIAVHVLSSDHRRQRKGVSERD